MANTAVVVLLVLIAIKLQSCQAIQYHFSSPTYTLQEGDTTNVILERTSDTPSELTTTTSVVFNTECPTECSTLPIPGATLADEGTLASGADYTIGIIDKTLTFAPNVNSLPISVSIHDDDIEEYRQYFCLSVRDENLRGSQWTTRIVIPWNDHCIEHESRFDGGSTATAIGYDITDAATAIFGYVGPWDTSAANPITLHITPQPSTSMVGATAGDGEDINIFLADDPDFLEYGITWGWYGIHLDDSFAAMHDGGAGLTNLDSWIADGALNAAAHIGTELTADIVLSNMVNTYELMYSSGTTTITRTSPSPSLTLTATDATSLLTIDHLFVSSALDKYAFWEICGLEPRRLPEEEHKIAVTASGSLGTFEPERAVDNIIDPASCFRSTADSNGKHWLQIDLGREFDVKKLIIFNIAYGADIILDIVDPEWLDNLQVYVGSCRPDDVYSNNVCDGDIGDVATLAGATQKGFIEVTCASGSYGRYVYLIPDTDTNPFQICEARVYGSEIHIDDETKVFFEAANSEVSVDEDISSGEVTLKISRTGSQSTCTYVDYYTDRSNGDFTEVVPAQELKITQDTTEITIDITDDDICEPTEDFNVYLTNIEGGILGYGDSLGTQCFTTVHIVDDDAMTYSIATPATSINEGSGPLNIQVDRTGEGLEQDGRATLTFTNVANGATSDDYDDLDVTLQFSSNNNRQTSPVNIDDDKCCESPETFEVSLNNLHPEECSEAGAGLPITMTIIDNDSKFEWDFDTDVILTIEEGSGPRTINIIREGEQQTKVVQFDVTYDTTESGDFAISPSSNSVSFAASASSHGSQPITISVVDDFEVEGDESFTLTLRDPLLEEGNDCPNGNRGDDYQLHVRIIDNDGVFNWENTAYSALESDGQREVCLTRSGDLTNSATVQISTVPVTPSAAIGSDIADLQQIFFPAGYPKACAQVQIIPDSSIESTEVFNLVITAEQGITAGTQHTATFTIFDDDSRVGWEQRTYEFSEAAGSSATVFISNTGNSGVTVSVTSSSETAISTVDFAPISISFTIPAQTTSYPLQLQFVNDQEDEPRETFVLTLTAIEHSTVSLAQTTITIIDDDEPIVTPPATLPPPPSGISFGAVVGIIAGAIVGLIVIGISAGVIFWIVSRRRVSRPALVVGNNTPQKQGQLQGQFPLVPLGFGNNAFGLPNNGPAFANNGLAYDNYFGNQAQFGANPYGYGFA